MRLLPAAVGAALVLATSPAHAIQMEEAVLQGLDKITARISTIKVAVGELWELAVALEEGALADAKAELQALKEELEKALKEGAPPERIAELMKRIRAGYARLGIHCKPIPERDLGAQLATTVRKTP